MKSIKNIHENYTPEHILSKDGQGCQCDPSEEICESTINQTKGSPNGQLVVVYSYNYYCIIIRTWYLVFV